VWIRDNIGSRFTRYTGILRSEDTSGFSLITSRLSLKKADGFTKVFFQILKRLTLASDFLIMIPMLSVFQQATVAGLLREV